MNCDEVFEILTRGPFPTGEPCDGVVEQHLAYCVGCRRLAEALRPALELFQESVAPEESVGLPGYRGRLQSRAHTPAVSCAGVTTGPRLQRNRKAQTAPAAQRSSSLGAWRVAAAIVLGITLGMVLRARELEENASPAAHAARDRESDLRASTGTRPRPRDFQSLAALGLKSACFGFGSWLTVPQATTATLDESASGDLPAADWDNLACCTECHNAADSHRVPIAAVSSVQKSCQSCHTN